MGVIPPRKEVIKVRMVILEDGCLTPKPLPAPSCQGVCESLCSTICQLQCQDVHVCPENYPGCNPVCGCQYKACTAR